ncbi:FecR family protein [Chitinophaga barathri]|nr:FecR domain-containing protein [Chitinophaga barathri]
MHTEQRFRELLDRYIAGNCTPQERAIIEEWFEKGGDVSKADLHLSPDDTSRLLANIHHLQDEPSVHRMAEPRKLPLLRALPRWRSVAVWAGILLAVGLGIRHAGKIRDVFSGSESPVVFLALVTGKGEIKQVTLPDGSVVLLNANSKLDYHPDFAGHRQLRLSGEALFTVTRDEAHPFTVLTGDSLTTTVLGTAFNINSYDKGEDIRISVVSGKVAVSKPGGALGTLTRAQAIRYHKAGKNFAVSHNVATENITSWSRGEWEYENLRFSDLALLLENQYGITLTSRLGQKELQTNVSINFSRKQPANEIMEVFCGFAGCRFRVLSATAIEIY